MRVSPLARLNVWNSWVGRDRLVNAHADQLVQGVLPAARGRGDAAHKLVEVVRARGVVVHLDRTARGRVCAVDRVRVRAGRQEQVVVLRVVERHGDGGLVVGDAAHQVAGALLIAAGPGRDAVVGSDLPTVVVLLEDDVDHTTDGVRAIDGRGAVLQHLDALDGCRRDEFRSTNWRRPWTLRGRSRRDGRQPARVSGGPSGSRRRRRSSFRSRSGRSPGRCR